MNLEVFWKKVIQNDGGNREADRQILRTAGCLPSDVEAKTTETPPHPLCISTDFTNEIPGRWFTVATDAMRLSAFSLSLSLLSVSAFAAAIPPEQVEFFEKKVRPVLAAACYKCHGPEKQKAGLRLDSRAAMLKGGDSGPTAVPGKPEESDLIKSVKHEDGMEMPEKADKLPDEQIAALSEWVKLGMPWPDNDVPVQLSQQEEAAKTHWSWQPIKMPELPAVKDEQKFVKTDLDRFVLAALEAKGIAPSAPASKRTLIRRATFDLIGLPPTTQEIDAFEKDQSPDAFAKVIDRLLASPRYGERWGRYWLDVARYADTKGYLAGNEERRFAYSYTYRDWVIDALNQDLPYDQFIIQQIAGDQVVKDGDNRPMAAQGFITLGRRFLNNGNDIIDDRIDVVTRGLMGVTVACARCHDHMFDPISQKDYYALHGVFNSSTEPETSDLPVLPNTNDEKTKAEYQKQLTEREAEVDKYRAQQLDFLAWRVFAVSGALLEYPALIKDKPFDQRIFDRSVKDGERKLVKKIEELNASPLSPPRAMALVDKPQPVTPRVFVRGNPGRPGDTVPRRFLSVLSGGDPKPFAKGSGRLELAQAIASKTNPLTPRVMVNRVWTLHFGKGLVRTPGDFGVKGEAPTNQALLDYLSMRFMEDGWSLKKLHRTMMLSATYQQASDERPDAVKADPENRLVWKMNRRRLDFEAMRDSLLASSGELDLTMHGRGVDLATKPYAKRRAVYGYIDRQNLPGVFRTFDFAGPDTSSPARFVTTVPQQALFMMNNPFVIEQAQALVKDPKYKEQNAYENEVQNLYDRVFARKAENNEVDWALRFVMDGFTNPAAREVEVPDWQYGYGGYDETTRKVTFQKMPVFKKDVWQVADKIPEPKLGHLILRADSGHAGRSAAQTVIRRWTAQKDGEVEINGTLKRPAEAGDGVYGRIVSSRHGQLLGVDAEPKAVLETKVSKFEVKKGDTVDFIVEPKANENSDTFNWEVTVGGENGNWDSKAQFAGPPPAKPKPLTPWEQYAQVLLETNEFAFVD